MQSVLGLVFFDTKTKREECHLLVKLSPEVIGPFFLTVFKFFLHFPCEQGLSEILNAYLVRKIQIDIWYKRNYCFEMPITG